jgi:hypothetical protein
MNKTEKDKGVMSLYSREIEIKIKKKKREQGQKGGGGQTAGLGNQTAIHVTVFGHLTAQA